MNKYEQYVHLVSAAHKTLRISHVSAIHSAETNLWRTRRGQVESQLLLVVHQEGILAGAEWDRFNAVPTNTKQWRQQIGELHQRVTGVSLNLRDATRTRIVLEQLGHRARNDWGKFSLGESPCWEQVERQLDDARRLQRWEAGLAEYYAQRDEQEHCDTVAAALLEGVEVEL